MNKYVIIVAGGSGTRMKSAVPKQFMLLGGRPVVMRTIEQFSKALPGIHVILVLAANLKEEWERLCGQYNFDVPFQLVNGGETRFHSVKNGLSLVPDGCIVGVHDAARPLVSEQTIRNAFSTAGEMGNASPAIAPSESMRELSGNTNKAVDRDRFRIIQTPQCFRSELLLKAFTKEYQPSFTDDASVLEASGEKINLIEGNRENIKITTSQDLIIAEALLKSLH